MISDFFLTFSLFTLVATLYSSVGHAGASGYLAVMALLSFQPAVIKSNSLILNVFVALIASIQFIRQGFFDRKVFLVFIFSSLPMAYIGGAVQMNSAQFKLLAGVFLFLSALLILYRQFYKTEQSAQRKINIYLGVPLGAVIGFISGVIGVGGGIFLSPIVITFGWTTVKKASGVAALFILLNSLFAIAGHLKNSFVFDSNLPYWISAVILGGLIGSHLGSKKMSSRMIAVCLFIVLMSAGLKFTFIDK